MIFPKKSFLLTLFILFMAVMACSDSERSVDPYLYTVEPFFDSKQIFESERFPNVLVATHNPPAIMMEDIRKERLLILLFAAIPNVYVCIFNDSQSESASEA
jgi:hypothetical protein